MNIEELEQIAETALREHDKYDYEVNVCMAMGCMSQHSDKIRGIADQGSRSLGQESAGPQNGMFGTMRGRSAGAG